MSTNENDLFILRVSGERFPLTKAQLESEPDSYFLTYFFGDFSEANEERKEITIMAEPGLFRLIHAHLRGYEIFPLAEGAVPYMSTKATLQNLRKEADFYGLQTLLDKIDTEIEGCSDSRVKEDRLVLTLSFGNFHKTLYFVPSKGYAHKAAFDTYMNTIKHEKAIVADPSQEIIDGKYKEIVSWYLFRLTSQQVEYSFSLQQEV